MKDLNDTDYLSELNQECGCQRSLFSSMETALLIRQRHFLNLTLLTLQPNMLPRQQFVRFAISL